MGTTLDTSHRADVGAGKGRRSNDRSGRPRSGRDRSGARQSTPGPLQSERLQMPGIDPEFWDRTESSR